MKVPACDSKMIVVCRELGLDVSILQMAARVNFRNNFELGNKVKRVYKIKSGAETGDEAKLTKAFKNLGFKVFSLHNTPMYLYTFIDGRALDARARHGKEPLTVIKNGPVPPVEVPPPEPEKKKEKAAPIQWTPNDAIINKIADRVVERLLNMTIRQLLRG